MEHSVINIKISDLKFDGENPNKMTTSQKEALKKSMEKFGYLAPIVVDQNNIVSDGEHRIEVYKGLGKETIPAYKVNFKTEAERKLFRQIANKLKGAHDEEQDAEEFKKLIEAGLKDDLIDFAITDDKEISKLMEYIKEGENEEYYTKKIETPQYKPSDKKPSITELYDPKKTRELTKEIKNLNLPEEEEKFLIATSQRFIEFRYDKIADYYAHSDKKTQEVMEKLALVLIDFEDAIQNGFIRLSKEIAKEYLEGK